jgi:hypothetical protein
VRWLAPTPDNVVKIPCTVDFYPHRDDRIDSSNRSIG